MDESKRMVDPQLNEANGSQANTPAAYDSTAQWRVLFENLHDAVLYVATDGTIIDANPAAVLMTGYSRRELLQHKFWDIVRPGGRIIGDAQWEELLHAGQHDGESAVCQSDGGQVIVQSRLVPSLQHGGHLVVLEETRRSDKYFRALIENSLDIIAVATPNRPARYESPSMYRLMGYTNSEATGRDFSEFVHPDDWSMVVDMYGQVLQEPGASRTMEYRFRHKNGSWRWMQSTSQNLLNNDAVGGIVTHSRDITAQKEGEARLRAAMAEAEEARIEAEKARIEAEKANRAKSEFLSRMSHELRTPLNAILGFGQILELGHLSPPEASHVGHILKGGRHLLALINEVLDIARIEAGKMELSLESIELCEVVEECCELVQPLADERGITLEHDNLAGNRGHVLADRQRLKQVLINLLSNGIKYNRDNGRVSILCRATSTDRTRIEVHDTGPGIAPEDLQKLFVPFERLNAEQDMIEGIGLGLVLSRRLVEMMGGELNVESAPGHGSVFYVELPSIESPLKELENSAPLLQAQEFRSSSRRRLLYIEDNISNSQLVEAIVADRLGMKIMTAVQGSVGLDLARQHRPDLILLDLHLPDISGREVLRRLRNAPETAKTPIVVLSADATAGQIESMLNPAPGQPRADAYLTKPLDIRNFLRILDEFLQG